MSASLLRAEVSAAGDSASARSDAGVLGARPMRACAIALLFLCACPPALRRPESTQLVLTGTVYAGGFARRGEPLPDVNLTVLRAEGGEVLSTNASSSAGGYRVAVTVAPATRVVLIADAPGFAPFARAFVVGPSTEVTSSFSLEPLVALECVDTSCTAPAVDVEWVEPPQGAGGQVASFEVELESPVQVDVDAQRPVVLALGLVRQATGAEGTLALRVPLARWSGLLDATPGNGTLEVAAASFDPTRAAWTRLAPVPLRTESGLPIPESDLPALQRGDYPGGAVALFPFVAERFFAVLGAREPEGCVTGTLTADGQPAAGATVALPGTEPVAADAKGAFCAVAATGDALLRAGGQYAGLPYAYGALPRPTTPAKCGGDCRQAGELKVLADALQVASLCKFSGRVVDEQGAPVANAEVVAFDDAVAGNAVVAFCGKTGTRCSLATPSGADGSFTLNSPLIASVYFGARASSSTTQGDVQRRGGQRFSSCPNEPLTLRLTRGSERLEVTASFLGNTLTWLPPRPAARISVLDSAGLPKWELVAPAGLTPPLTFGVVPPGATELTAVTGAPSSGDSVEVELDGVGREGLVYLGGGSATRP